MTAERPVSKYSGIGHNQALAVVDGTDGETEAVRVGDFTIGTVRYGTMSVATARVASRLAMARNLKRWVEKAATPNVPVLRRCGIKVRRERRASLTEQVV